MFKAKISFLLQSVALLLTTVNSQRDLTIVEKAIGKDVVEATIRKVERTGIFLDDNSFFVRIAYTESRFGEWNETFRSINNTEYLGGIWQVDEEYFNHTLESRADLNTTRARIQTELNIDWGSLTWRDLLKPLHSFLACALYFKWGNHSIPQPLDQQAALWAGVYRPPSDNRQRFIDDSNELRNRTKCRGKLDLCIVLDSSGSIGDTNYRRATGFTADVIGSFTLDYSRMGMLIYAASVENIFPIQNNYNISEMMRRATNARYMRGGTRTDLGILRAMEFFNDTKEIEGVPKVMTVFTDGDTNEKEPLREVLALLKNSTNIKPISVGIGSGITYSELLDIALGDARSVFQLANFQSLQDFLYGLTTITCEIPQVPELNGTYTDTLEQNERRIYQIEIPPVGITIRLDVTSGSVKGYWSYTEEVPSSALHDGELSTSTYVRFPSNTEGMRLSRFLRQDGGSNVTVYFSIEGEETMNEYTVSTDEGGSDGGAATIGLALSLLTAMLGVHFLNY